MRTDLETMQETLAHVQTRCTQLREENLGLKRAIDLGTCVALERTLGYAQVNSYLMKILADILCERGRQDAKWGSINERHYRILDGTGPDFVVVSQQAQDRCKEAEAEGTLTWRHILEEEVEEALNEPDPHRLREELVQVAAVCAKWIQVIDERVLARTAATRVAK